MGPHLQTELKAEACVMCLLRHPNVVMYLGCVERPHFAIVQEYMSNGSLMNYLAKTQDIPFPMRLKIAVHVCAGMLYLHTLDPPLLHRDLKSPNILLDDNLVAKVSDFGLSQYSSDRRFKASGQAQADLQISPVHTTGETCSNPEAMETVSDAGEDFNTHGQDVEGNRHIVGSLLWMGPEVLMGEGNTRASDVYAMGIILWELLTQEMPYSHLKNETHSFLLAQVVLQDLRPLIPDKLHEMTPTEYIRLMRECWDHRPHSRPSFESIQQRLQALTRPPLTVEPLVLPRLLLQDTVAKVNSRVALGRRIQSRMSLLPAVTSGGSTSGAPASLSPTIITSRLISHKVHPTHQCPNRDLIPN
eukprot:Opistho-2@35962